MTLIETIGFAASVALPLWNIPLILRIIQRKSSSDISTTWAFGVWACILLMAPSGFMSSDLVWKAFNICNFIFFTGVVIAVWIYRERK